MSDSSKTIVSKAFFDTYQTLGVATEIMGITPEGWAAIAQMERGGWVSGYNLAVRPAGIGCVAKKLNKNSGECLAGDCDGNVQISDL